MRSHTRQHLALLASAALLATLALACSSLGGDGGGASNLPNRGITPYEPVALDEAGSAVVLPDVEGMGLLREPAAVDVHGVVLLYVERRDVADPTTASAHIEHADSDDGGLTWSPLEPILEVAQVSFATRRVGAPSVARLGERYHMVFATDDRAIGYATSDDGHTFTPAPSPLLTLDDEGDALAIDSPSIVPAPDGGFAVYYAVVRPNAEGAPSSAVALATFDDPDHVERMGVVFSAGTDCADPFGVEAPCWDADSITAPDVRLATTPAGRKVHRMFYVGRRGNSAAVGFAASFDGASFERFPFNPVLEGAPAEPTNILSLDRFLLLYVDRKGGIALAINDHGTPSERF